MKNGLKLFSAFEGLFLEARVGVDAKKGFLKKYAITTTQKASQADSFLIRTKNGWPNALDTKIYFEAPEWVRESLGKLGFRIVKRQIDMFKYKGGLREYTWKICSNELFWWLLDYGYRLGKNNAIPYEFYEMRKTLQTMSERKKQIIPNVDIKQIEILSPVCEAQMLVA